MKFECAQYCGEASAGDRFSSVVRIRNGHNAKGWRLEAAHENFKIGFETEKINILLSGSKNNNGQGHSLPRVWT
jgi:hypothetical protein